MLLNVILLIVASTAAFATPALNDGEILPDLENPPVLTSFTDLEGIPNTETATSSDGNLFLNDPPPSGEPLIYEAQNGAEGSPNNDGLLAGLGSPSEPLNPLDIFGLDNPAGPSEERNLAPNLAAPDFPLPECYTRLLLCCSGRQFAGVLYSKCNWCKYSNSMGYDVRELISVADYEENPDCQIKYFLFCCEYFFVSSPSHK